MAQEDYIVMERVEGNTLNELAYMNPDAIEDNAELIARELGKHTAFSYIFGIKDGYQTNYIFNPKAKKLTRIDKEKCLSVPKDPERVFMPRNRYTQEIAECEISNLKYLPAYRRDASREVIFRAFTSGFYEQYALFKDKKAKFLDIIKKARDAGKDVYDVAKVSEYDKQTEEIVNAVNKLIEQNPSDVLERLFTAKNEVMRGEFGEYV